MSQTVSGQQVTLADFPFHVLLSLGNGEPAHGYGIGRDVEKRSGGRLRPTTGGLYLALKRMADQGLIERVARPDDVSSGGRRQYWRITQDGRSVAAREARRLEDLVNAARDQKLYGASS